MDQKNPLGLILLTYKNKILLMHKQNSVIDKELHSWSLIGGRKEKSESFEKAMFRCVQKEMGIKIGDIEFLSDCCYHARLTDTDVNNIKRKENQLLDFFSLSELKKLTLSSLTQQLVFKYGSAKTSF